MTTLNNTDNKTNQFDPCPFCGSSSISLEWESLEKLDLTDTTRRWFAECNGCACQEPFCQYEKDVVSTWNKRLVEIDSDPFGVFFDEESPEYIKQLKFLEIEEEQRKKVYVIYGRKLDVNLIKNSEIEMDENLYFPWCGKDAAGKLGVLYDGLDGEYCIAGYCMIVGETINLIGIDPINIDLQMLESVNTWIYQHKLYKFLDEETESGNKIWVLTHFH